MLWMETVLSTLQIDLVLAYLLTSNNNCIFPTILMPNTGSAERTPKKGISLIFGFSRTDKEWSIAETQNVLWP